MDEADDRGKTAVSSFVERRGGVVGAGSDVSGSMDIAAVSRATGLSQRMIRHYEDVGVIPPPARRPSGHRTYSEVDVGRLRLAATARAVGFELPEIRELVALWSDPAGDVGRWRTAIDGKGELLAEVERELRRLAADERPRFPYDDG